MAAKNLFVGVCVLALSTTLASSATAQTTRLRLMGANITSGNGQSYDPGEGKRIFQGLDPDVVMIQEFNYGTNNTADIRAFVDSAFGTTYSYFREAGAQIPNGIISRYPIISSGEWDDTSVSNRDFAWARIDVPGTKDLWVISVHLLTSGSAVRNTEATQLKGLIQANIPAGDYLAIGGDFNTGSRTEACITTLGAVVVTTSPYPADKNGNGNTNASRAKPYDWLVADADLNQYKTSVIVGASTFANGLVFDSRVYTPLAEVAPVLLNDSGATNMQHMATVKDFLIPTGGGPTPTATPTPSPSPSPTATASPTASPSPSLTPSPTASPTASPSPTAAPASAWINEIHYDNSGTDANEGVEIAGTAGTSLVGWKLVAYNGSGGASYSTTNLTGTIPNQQNGYGTLWFAIVDLQNGAPDGIALVNSSGTVVKFLSYEGSFVATNGQASGLTSTNIGTGEAGTVAGGSLQLQGTGNGYSSFTWSGEIGHTRGLKNTGQTFQ